VFIHSIIFVGIGSIGIIISCLLYFDLKKKRTGMTIWWICFQAMEVIHQIFFSFEVIAIVNHNLKNDYVLILVSAFLGALVLLDIYFISVIVNIYQENANAEVASWPSRSAWRVPTISELLGDESVMGESIAPRVFLDSQRGVRNSSDA
jgi:Domain of unknown function (DUF4728)